MTLFSGDFKRFFYTPVGKIIISVLLGLGIATLFRKVCREKNCIEFRGPVFASVEGKIFQYDDQCFAYTPRAGTCDPAKKTVDLVTPAAAHEPPLPQHFHPVALDTPPAPLPTTTNENGGGGAAAPAAAAQTPFSERAANSVFSFFEQRLGFASSSSSSSSSS